MMAGNTRPIVALLQFTIFLATLQSVYSAYFGKFLGKLSELHHGVSGEVYAVDARTLYLKDFTYDGQGPAAYFYAGNSRSPGNGGFRLRDENGSPEVIRRYRREGVTLTLPEGKTLNNIKWFSVWCEEFAVNFGDVKIPRNFDYPRPRKIDALRGVHGISSDNIVIVDAQTLLVPNLSYDGEAPDAKFWVGRGPKPSPQGVRVPDENGKEVPLRRYDRKTVVLTLPGDLTVFDIGHFGIWCEAFTVDFGHTQIPQNLNVPPSLKMLGVSPQKRPRGFDYSEVSRPQAQLVGGHLEATTFRPPHFSRQFALQPLGAQRRADAPGVINQQGNHHELVNRDLYNRAFVNTNQNNLINQPQVFHNNLQQRSQNSQPQFVFNQYNQQQQQQQQNSFLQQQQLLNQQRLLQQQQLLAQQQQHFFPQQRAGTNVHNQQYVQQTRQSNQYFPINSQQQHQQQQLQEQLIYNQLLQNRRLQEEQQLRAQLNRQYNRFDLSGNSNNYASLG